MGDRQSAALSPPSPGFATELRRCCWQGRERAALTAAAVAFGVVYSFWPTLAKLADKWLNDPQYSHGLLVPPFALALLWMRRNQFPASVWPAFASGLALLIVGAVGRVLGGAMYFEWLNTASLLPVVAGLVLAFGGWSVLRWSLPAVAFLIFMIPMPYSIVGLPSS